MRYFFLKILLWAVLLTIPISSSLAFLLDRYVSTAGNDSENDCTNPLTPCKTIQYAIDQGQGSVKVAQGIYQEDIYPSNWIRLLQGGWSSDFNNRSKYPTLTKVGGIYTCFGDSAPCRGIDMIDKIEGFTITGGVTFDCNDWEGTSPVFELSNNIISGSGIEGGAWLCHISLKSINNIIYGSDKGILLQPDYSPPGSITALLINNTIVNNDVGIESVALWSATANFDMINTIIWGNDVDIDISSGGTVSASYSNIGSGSYNDDGTNISVDPVFLNTANGDFHLSSSSQCVDAGTNTNAPLNDIEGTNRPFDGNDDGQAITDIGAYEQTFVIFSAVVTPLIDGNLLEYDNADSIVFSPSSGENTVIIKALWDNYALYLAYDVNDTELNAAATVRDGGVWWDDSVEWGIDTLNDNGGSGDPNSNYMLPDDYHGIINILNTQYDEQGTASGSPSSSWNGNWQSAVIETGSGYTVEVKIPWTEIDFSPADNKRIVMGFLLNDKDNDGSYNYKMWTNHTETASFPNASNWEGVLLSANCTPSIVRIAGNPPVYYSTLQSAYDSAGESDIIQSRNLIFNNDLHIDLNKLITLDGGYHCDFSDYIGNTIINGDMVISDGVLTIGYGSIMIKDIIPVPDTGQTESYTSTFGEDSDYTINPPSYTVNSDPVNGYTVTDNVTGLMWQRCRAGQNNDAACSGTASGYNWYQASGTYDAAYNPGTTNVCGSASVGGYTDWRLPDEYDLMGIVDYGNFSPAIDTGAFPNTISSSYWSSTTDASYPISAWGVYFYNGNVGSPNKTWDFYYVRCVRGGKGTAHSFTANGDGTVTDNVTGLMWQQEDDNIMRDWETAITYCEDLVINPTTYSDWRLPNIKELRSIVDNSQYNPAIDTGAFPNTISSRYWSSTTGARYPISAWYVNFYDSIVNSLGKSYSYDVRCVRGGQ